jgi:hypothetical protein
MNERDLPKRRRVQLPSELRRFKQKRHWRLTLALMADRIERRIGRHMTDLELNRLVIGGDPLLLREMWLRYGGTLVVDNGRLELSKDLPRHTPVRWREVR